MGRNTETTTIQFSESELESLRELLAWIEEGNYALIQLNQNDPKAEILRKILA